MGLEHVILSTPTVLDAASYRGNGSGAKRSWIQLARTGAFVSNRYGKFAITKDDLTQMLHNFREVTPKAPTELPVDFDHRSMDPKNTGDGIAAGWMKNLELRKDGDELWAEVEWTPTAARQIAEQEYRFVSPSFVKDHTHKNGEKIGTTLLAAAITNHPFLEGMKALTLFNFSAMGDLALPDDGRVAKALHLTEIGQRVMIAPGEAHTQDEVGGTFEISEVIGEGDDAFVTVKDALGNAHKWFKATDLLPASATPANPAVPALPVPAAAGAAGAVPGVGAGAVPGAAAGVPGVSAPLPGAPGAPVVGAGAVPGVPGVPDTAAVSSVAPVPVPGAPDVAAAKAVGAVGAVPAPGADVAKAVADAVGAAGAGETPKTDEKKDENKSPDAEGAVGAVGAIGTKKDDAPADAGKPKTDNDGDLREAIKRAVTAALAAAAQQPQPQLQPVNMADDTQKGSEMKFMLRNDKNEQIEVTSEQLKEAGITVVPDGHTAVPTGELSDLKDSVKNLSSTVATMQSDAQNAQKAARTVELSATLDRLSRGGFVTKVTRDALFEQFKDAMDLSVFRAIAGSFNTPIIDIEIEHGTGGEAGKTTGEQATEKLVNLSNQLMRDRGISLRDATIEAGKQLAGDAESYRDQFAEV